MPLFRIDDKIHFYAHVPKCAGTSIELYLAERFGPLAFENRLYLRDPEITRWTKSSPQHVPLEAFHKLIPKSWITSSFAVVRHPVKRLVSAFIFQSEVEKTVPTDCTIDSFFADWLKRKEKEPFLYDGHLLPQSELVPQDAAVFRMEDGLEAVVAHLDKLAGNRDGPRKLANAKKAKPKADASRYDPSEETLASIAEYYSRDFERFNYDLAVPPANQSRTSEPAGLFSKLLLQLKQR